MGGPTINYTEPAQLSEFTGAFQLLHPAKYSFVRVKIPSRKPVFLY